MKKVGILTHSGSDDNYGQILQHYALQYYLKQKGYTPYLIKYSSDKEQETEKLHFLKQILRYILSLISKTRRKTYNQIAAYSKRRKLNFEINKKRKFHEFIANHITIGNTYDSYKNLESNPPNAFAYIVGSDQVWNIDFNSVVSHAWFLDFGDKSTKRIAYAASVGRRISDLELPLLKKHLSRFDNIGVREASIYLKCIELGFKRAQVVLDPTLLLTAADYSSITKEQHEITRPYLFIYYLNIDNPDVLGWNYLHKFITDKNLDCVSVSSSGYIPAIDLIPNQENALFSIPEWLNAIKYAQYIVTTSFHGIVFAIIFHRQFVAIPLKNQYSGGNERIQNLLEAIGLESRIAHDYNEIPRILDNEINWDDVRAKLNELRRKSADFLWQSLKA